MHIRKRTLARIVSFGIAGTLAFGSVAAVNGYRLQQTRQTLEYTYLRAVGDLSGSVDNIKSTLNKGLYAVSSEMMAELSGKLSMDASAAKAELAQLPTSELNLEKTNKFLSQVGNYAKALSKKAAKGEAITKEETDNLNKLYKYSQTLSDELWNVQMQIQSGYVTLNKAKRGSGSVGVDTEPAGVTDGFADVEGGFDSYPSLIYDGPFSDHIMEKKPKMLSGLAEVDKAEAHKIAETQSGVHGLEFSAEEAGNMPSYEFKSGDTTVSVTKAGGLYAYKLAYRQVDSQQITIDKAVSLAENYLTKLGIKDIAHTYYETIGGVCTVNFAGTLASESGRVTLYTDLIKVGVAMDNGEILTYDAHGYIMNHVARKVNPPALTVAQAEEKVSKTLSIQQSKLAVIPSEGLNEKLCYEFLVKCPDERDALIYINADSGAEEQILLLEISENGVLTV